MEAHERLTIFTGIAPYMRWALRHAGDLGEVGKDLDAFNVATDSNGKCDAIIAAVTHAKPAIADFPWTLATLAAGEVELSFEDWASDPQVVALGGAGWLDVFIQLLPIIIEFIKSLRPILFPTA